MTRPDWCPQDVWEAACEGLAVEYEATDRAGPYPTYAGMARRAYGDFTLCSIFAIARAILTERERCAGVAEDYCSEMPDLAGHGHSSGIADAILRGTP